MVTVEIETSIKLKVDQKEVLTLYRFIFKEFIDIFKFQMLNIYFLYQNFCNSNQTNIKQFYQLNILPL